MPHTESALVAPRVEQGVSAQPAQYKWTCAKKRSYGEARSTVPGYGDTTSRNGGVNGSHGTIVSSHSEPRSHEASLQRQCVPPVGGR